MPHDWGMAVGLAVLALWIPSPLYLVALACFGLPHVIWEMMWIRKVSANRLPRHWWVMLFAILAIQASGRALAASESLGAKAAVMTDLLTLALAVAMVVVLSGGGWRAGLARLAAVLGAVALASVGVLAPPETMVMVLITFSVAHNFTPLGLERLTAKPDETWSSLRWIMILPLVLLFLPALPQPDFLKSMQSWPPMEFLWLRGEDALTGLNLFPALVLAQCLHYLAVLRILPRRLDGGWGPGRWRNLAVIAGGLATMGFIWSFPDARRFYGVAAGVHAWVEWPILLCLLGGIMQSGRTVGPIGAEGRV
ncbi:hypothetical protein [Paramagnetospirillum kuznetsovii]|nr:hypothetical protein [Paramagnetospirillum kuznetsovii]